MEHARQWFVDLSRFMMGGSEAVCERGKRVGGGDGRHEGQLLFQCRILKGWKSLGGGELGGWVGPSTVESLFDLIVFLF